MKNNKSPADKIWAILRETVEIGKKSQRGLAQFKKEESARRAADKKKLALLKHATEQARRKTEKALAELAESQKKTDRQIQKTEGSFNDRWGKLVESLVAGKLAEKQGLFVIAAGDSASIVNSKGFKPKAFFSSEPPPGAAAAQNGLAASRPQALDCS